MTCLNCSTDFQGNFCPHCGQSASTHRYTVKSVSVESVSASLDLDEGWMHTIKVLSIRPGKAIREFVQGKRVSLFHPSKYLLLIGTLATILSLRYRFFSGESAQIEMNFMSVNKAFVSDFLNYADEYTTLINILTIPVFSLFSWLCFKKSGFNFAENLVLNTYITSHQMLLLILLVPLFEFSQLDKSLIIGVYTIITLVYNVWVYIQFFQMPFFKEVSLSVLAIILSYAGQLILNLLFYSFWRMI